MRLDADLLLANSSRVRRAPDGTGSVPVDDWSETPPLSREIALERHESPPERAQRLYHQARRMERGAEMAERRWLQVEEQLEALATLRAEVLAAEHQRALDRARERAQAMGLRELDDAALPKPNGAATKKRRMMATSKAFKAQGKAFYAETSKQGSVCEDGFNP